MTALTNTAIDKLPAGGSLKDDKVPGLSVRATASGKSWMLYYRTKIGTERRPKLGAYPLVSIAKARDIARSMLVQVAAGQDPVGERDAVKNELTVDDLWDRCEREVWCSGKTWDREAKRLYVTRLKPKLGHLRISAVAYEQVQPIYNSMKATPVAANRVLAVLSKMMRLAEKWRMRPRGTNPVTEFSGDKYTERKRKRYAKPEELKSIGAILEHGLGRPDNIAFLYVLAFSGARPSEIERATPDMVDRVTVKGRVYGVLRIAEGKTGERTVYLPPQAMAALDRLPADRERLAGAFPRRLWRSIKAEVGCKDLWCRDLRRTFATVGMSNGVASSQIGELLGHASTQTTKIYAKLMEDAGLKAAGSIADKMAEMLGGTPGSS